MLDKIDELKKTLDKMIIDECEEYENILKISEELDILIIQYYKEIGVAQ